MKEFLLGNGLVCFEVETSLMKKAGFGACMEDGEHIVICDQCNEEIRDTAYYVPVLNMAVCRECLEGIAMTRKYKEDAEYEKRNTEAFKESIELARTGMVDLEGRRNIYVMTM